MFVHATPGGRPGAGPRDSPFFDAATPSGRSSSSTPSHETHFDPHDPSWFTPQLSVSASAGQGSFLPPPVTGYEAGGEWDDCEVLAGDLYRNEQGVLYEPTPRRHSEGGQVEYQLMGGQSFGDMRQREDSGKAGLFDSDWTFGSSTASSAPSPFDPAASYHSNYTHSSHQSTLGHTPATSVEQYPSDTEMTFSPTSGSYAAYLANQDGQPGSAPRATYGPQVVESASSGPDLFSVDHSGGAYSLNLVSTVQTYASINYSPGPVSQQYQQDQPASASPHAAYPQKSRGSTSSTASSASLQPSPFPASTSSSCTSFHPTPTLQPSPFSPSCGSSFSPSPQRTSNRRARRPSLAHAHTQAVPELSAMQQGQEQLFSPLDSSGAASGRHHSFSGAIKSNSAETASLHSSVGPAGSDEYRRHSLQQQPTSYSPYNPQQSPYARRRSSQNALAASAPASSSPIGGRRISAPSAPSTPSQLSRITAQTAEARGSPSSAPFSPHGAQPTTPTRRSSSSALSSGPGTPHRNSPSSLTSRRNNPNLTISVDAASSLAPPQQRASRRSQGNSPISGPHSPYSPFSPQSGRRTSFGLSVAQPPPVSPFTISGGEFGQPPMASPSASRKRRFSADVGLETTLVGSSLGGYAGAEATGAAALRALSTTYEEDSTTGEAYLVQPQQLHPPNGLYQPQPGYSTPNPQPVQQQQQQQQHSYAPPTPTYGPNGWDSQQQQQLNGPVVQHLADGTVGLGLEIGVEELHIAPHAAATSGGIAPGIYLDMPGQHAQQQLVLAPESSSSGHEKGWVSYAPSHQQQLLQVQQQQQPPQQLVQYDSAAGEEARQRRLEGEIRAFLRAENKLEFGQKTVIVMSPKIAQRSYGTEKRLLAPPPMALLLGASWWSTLDSQSSRSVGSSKSGRLPSPLSPYHRETLPPNVFISISTDKSPVKHAATLSWLAPDGKLVLDREEDDTPPISGRAVSKSLAVSVPGELNKDVNTTVRTIVSITEPGPADAPAKVWAMVPGKPITVISKPSKKRSITAGSAAGLTHGTLVSLYNRTKTYTGSTRYLCTSGVQSMFPLSDWGDMAGQNAPRAFAPNDIRDVRFVAKTTSWDAFIIYAVDLDPASAHRQPPTPLHPNYPTPPPSCIPIDLENPKPLYYNEPIVLQDISTGVISPILIIRRCDLKGVAVGGGSMDGLSPPPSEVDGFPVAPGEKLGEPVSQYRPIALEVFQDISSQRSLDPFRQKLPDDQFLGVNDDTVGVHHAEEARSYVKPMSESASQPVTPTTPRSFSCMQLQQLKQELVELNPANEVEESKSRRAKAVPTRPPATLAKSRRRTSSAIGLTLAGQGAPKIWTIPVGDQCVWSIVNVDIDRHSFYIPPSVHGKPPNFTLPSTHNPLYSMPTPFAPIVSVPAVSSIELSSTRIPEERGMYVLRGENFSQDLTVWVGDAPSPAQPIFKSSSILLFHPPSSRHQQPGMQFLPPSSPALSSRISLVRHDGVVFRTPVSLPNGLSAGKRVKQEH
ncbi:hypothetical protein JCM8547_003632 [Rhodosporidiobolus lusitaniae]